MRRNSLWIQSGLDRCAHCITRYCPVVLTHCILLQYVLLKFLGPRGEGTERVGVHTVRLFGYKSTAEQLSSTTFLQELVRKPQTDWQAQP